MSMNDLKAQAARAEAARTELGIAASVSERKNKPKVLVVLALLLLLGAGIYAATQFQARGEALAKLNERRERTEAIRRLVGEIETLKKKETARGLDPDPRVAAKLETLAEGVGFKLSGPVSDAESMSTGVMVQKKYSARAANQDPVALLRWLQATQSGETPGLEIARLSVRPGAGGGGGGEGAYNVDIDFTRWEKRK